MPPWKPHSGAGVFREAARLSPLENEVLRRWAENGRPKATPPTCPPMPTFPDGWQLGEPDVVVTMPEPFTVPATGRDVYQAFTAPLDLGRDVVDQRRSSSARATRRVVHHSRLYLDATGDARRRDLADPGTRVFRPQPKAGGRRAAVCRAWRLDSRHDPALCSRRGRAAHSRSHRPRLSHPLPYDRQARGRSFERRSLYRQEARDAEHGRLHDSARTSSTSRRATSGTRSCSAHGSRPTFTSTQSCRMPTTFAANFAWRRRSPTAQLSHYSGSTTGTSTGKISTDILKPVRLPKGTLLTLAVYFDNSESNPATRTSPRKRALWPGSRRRDVRLPPRVASRRPERLRGVPRQVAVRTLSRV